jgi:hypothetical protein
VQLEAEAGSPGRLSEQVDRLLAALPAALFRQVKLLEYDLALRYSPTGQFRDVFTGLDHLPMTSIATWLLTDLHGPSSAARDATEARLFTASLLLAARVQAIEGMRDPAAFTGDDRIALVQWLSEQASAEIARVVPRDSAFWELHDELVSEDAGRLAAEAGPNPEAGLVDQPEAFLVSPFSAPARLVAAAAMAFAGRHEEAARVAEMVHEMAQAFEVPSELASIQRDLQLGRVSYPIAFVANAARLPLRPAPRPEVILGAMVATGSLRPIVESALGRLRSARRAALDLDLPSFSAFLSDAEAHLDARLAAWLPGAGAGSGSPRRGAAPVLRQSTPALPQALGMAQRFLLADPTFRESWETHREGMLGQPEVVSRFPAGLVLEMLCRHGLDVREPIDAFLSFTLANGFRYYDHPRSGVDSDTIGVFLRLLPHAAPDPAYGQGVSAVLDCLERNVQETGAIPVWVSGCHGEEKESDVVALGEGCGTVAAHLLLGLIPSSSEPSAAVATGARRLLDRIGSVRLGANVNYPPLFALGTFFRLLRSLDASPLGEGPWPEGDAARGALNAELERVIKVSPWNAQDAALLTLACHDANREDLVEPDWIVRVLKQQRCDGSWIGEPFAAAPNRGQSVSWYSSTLLTSAICHDALARHANQLGRATD